VAVPQAPKLAPIFQYTSAMQRLRLASSLIGMTLVAGFVVGVASPAMATSSPTISGAPSQVAAQYRDLQYNFAVGGSPEPSVSVTSGELPPGVRLDESTGRVTGMPTTVGTYKFTLTADNGNPPSAQLPVEITVAGPPSVHGPLPAAKGEVGKPYELEFTVQGLLDPTVYLAGSLPEGLTLNPSGVLSGTTVRSGWFYFSIVPVNTANVTGRALQVSVDIQGPPHVAGAAEVVGKVGQAFTANYTVTGSPAPTTVIHGTVPLGLAFDAYTGTLSGTPAQPGVYTFTIAAYSDYSQLILFPVAKTVNP
jgi:hypothetical protein